MSNTLDRLYYDYYQQNDAFPADSDEYTNAQKFATELLEKAIARGAIAEPCAIDRIVATAMSDAKHQGFVEGFRYATSLLAGSL